MILARKCFLNAKYLDKKKVLLGVFIHLKGEKVELFSDNLNIAQFSLLFYFLGEFVGVMSHIQAQEYAEKIFKLRGGGVCFIDDKKNVKGHERNFSQLLIMQ